MVYWLSRRTVQLTYGRRSDGDCAKLNPDKRRCFGSIGYRKQDEAPKQTHSTTARAVHSPVFRSTPLIAISHSSSWVSKPGGIYGYNRELWLDRVVRRDRAYLSRSAAVSQKYWKAISTLFGRSRCCSRPEP